MRHGIGRYIGVTGFTERNQVKAVHRGSNIGLKAGNPLLMVGVLASSKTLAGEASKRSPDAKKIPSVFYEDEGLLNLIHYHSHAQGDNLLSELFKIRERGGEFCHGLQLNMAFPEKCVLDMYMRYHRNDTVVLQVNSGTFRKAGNNPSKLAHMVKPYIDDELVTHVLLDRSGGKGVPLDAMETMRYVDALAQAGVTNGVSIAGGLSAEKAYLLSPLFKEFPYLSVDAEGALHTGEQHGIFVCDRAIKWVNAALRVQSEAM